ncbi:MAG TPA: polyhydroxyalkanoate synthesis repressor PhaR [Burkholderiaceae bacterium]|jgi:polyhydroxyalkanoate synthesis repressor PhaR|nr:polyhydroxyalkanoate synthesis repressor PhaR [Burkholderiaceae bacterium]
MVQAKANGQRGSTGAHGADELRVLKKYPNRRLYDTRTSSYITLADVKQMVLENDAFVVRDAKSNEDLTRSILLQIILEEETGGVPMFSTQMLAHIIRFYGHTLQGLMGTYLEKNIQAFIDMQARFAEQSGMGAGKAFTPEMWTQFMNVQTPVMQGLMTSYLDQSKNLFAQMQDQMSKQAETLFPAGFKPPGKR